MKTQQNDLVTFVGLFASVGTLLCCALPALFVALGLGAVVAGVVAHVPALIWLSERKVAVFIIAGFLIVISGSLQWRARYLPCPSDPKQADVCSRVRKINLFVFGASVLIYCAGGFVSFILPRFFQ